MAIRPSQATVPVSTLLPLIVMDRGPDVGLKVAADPDQPRSKVGKLTGEVLLLTASDGSVARTLKLLKVTSWQPEGELVQLLDAIGVKLMSPAIWMLSALDVTEAAIITTATAAMRLRSLKLLTI